MLADKEIITKPELSTLNLAALPLQVQVELIDFYEFLIKKYNLNTENENDKNTQFKKFLETPIQVDALQNKDSNLGLEKKINYWAKIGKIAEENPDLSFEFVKTILLAREEALTGQTEPYLFD